MVEIGIGVNPITMGVGVPGNAQPIYAYVIICTVYILIHNECIYV